MGKVKEFYHEELMAIQNALEAKCSCPQHVSGMDDMCPVCLAEYEQNLVDNYESYSEAGILMTEEQYEREIQESTKKLA
jgi:hypothetical protein